MGFTNTRMRIGLSNVVYALMTETSDVSAGTITYGTVSPLPGARALSFDRGASIANVFGDDGAFAVGETSGEMKVQLEIADILPQDYANLLGFTYSNGIIAEDVSDQSPYVAVGFKTLRMGTNSGTKVYEYFWLPKVKFMKPKNDEKTKEKSLAPRTVSLDGEALRTISSNKYIVRARDDDSTVATATITGWFTTPLYSGSQDLGAFTLTSAAGTISTKTFVITFGKAGGGTTTVQNYTLNNVVISVGSTAALLTATTWTPGAASTTPTLTVVCSAATVTGVPYTIAVTNGVTDANGMPCVTKTITCTPA